MISSILGFSIRNRLIILLLVSGIIAWGIYGLIHIPIDAVPDITNNQVQVVTVSPSLAPQEVEKFITQPLEFSMANLPDVVEIRSVSRYGLSVVTIVFEEKMKTLAARQLVAEQINIAKGNIPTDFGEPELMPITTGLGELYQYSLEVEPAFESQYSAMDLREIQDWIVKRRLSGIPGIIEIGSFGGYLKEFEVGVDPFKLQNFDLSITDVFTALEKGNQNTGSSYIQKGPNAYYIRAEGLLESLESLKEVVITLRNGVPVKVGDVATVTYGHAPRFGAMTKNGKGEAVGGIAFMLKGANSMETVGLVQERVKEINLSLPEGVTIVPYLDRSSLVNRAISTVKANLIEGGLIVIFILILFLGNFRAGLIVSSVIPLSMLFALGMMEATGVSANLMSLGAIDFGIIIDGAVIVVESVLYNLHVYHKGKTLTGAEMNEVVKSSTSRIFRSAAFGVMIILIVFLPILSLVGIEGKMFRPMAQTVIYALIGALLLSLTYVPMISAWVLKKKISEKENFADKIVIGLQKFYKPILERALALPRVIVGLAFTLFLISIFTFTRMGGEFIPTLEEGDLAMQITLPPGSSLDQSVKISTMAEEILLRDFPEVTQVISKIGTAEVPTDPMPVEEGDVMIILKPKEEWTSTDNREDLANMMKESLAEIPGIEFDFTQPIQLRFNELMTGVKTDIAVKIFGEEMDILHEKADAAAAIIATVNGAADIKVEQVEGMQQYRIRYNRENLARYGLNVVDVNKIIEASFAGAKAGIIFQGERRFDLVVRLDSTHRMDLNFEDLLINTPDGRVIPISEIADLIQDEGPLQVSREDTKRRVTIGINVRNRDVESLVEEIQDKLEADLNLAPGYYVTYGGQFENLKEAKDRLTIAVPLALVLIIVLLYFAFGSVRFALLIFSAVPLSAIGGVAALYLRDLPFSISAGVGFIALFGVAVLNGIVLINYMNDLKEEGNMSLKDIIVNGSLIRLRPVLMTASTDILGFLPMALSNSGGAEVQRPLATVVIGGLISSTILTLIVLPILYQWMNSKYRPSVALLILPLFLIPSFYSQAQTLDVKTLSIEEATELALKNHPLIQQQIMKIESAELKIGTAWDLPATELGYQYGQINSNQRDPFFEIRQNLGSIPGYIQSAKVSQAELDRLLASNKLEKTMLKVWVQKAYIQWLYWHDLKTLLLKQQQMMADYERLAKLRVSTGEAAYLEELTAQTQLENAKLRLEEANRQLEKASSQLAVLLFEDGPFKPPYSLDELDLGNSETQVIDANSHPSLEVSKLEIELSKQTSKLAKADLFPSIYVGYFNQRITDRTIQESGLSGFNVGIGIPLWAKPTINRIKMARVDEQIREADFSIQTKEKGEELKQLSIEISRLRDRLSYYNQTGLPQAIQLQEIAERQFRGGEASYLEYLQAMKTYWQISEDHLRALMDYHSSSSELTYFTNN
ncbi:CusA/CzcA family heavy metal efflux RND transporter [Peijinzhouia sedimentorum]